MKVFNKFIESKKEPSNKNDIWFDGSTVRLYKEGEWYTVTLSKEAIERLLQYAENVDIFKYVNELPEVGDPTFVYFKKEESNENLIVLPYVYDGEWKQITNTEVFSEFSPLGFGEAKNSAVLKGGDNQVISEGGVALGKDNLVGLKGWYINRFDRAPNGAPEQHAIIISSQNTELDPNYNMDSSFENPYEAGDIISIQIGSIFTDIGTIISTQGNYIEFIQTKVFSTPQSDPEKRYYLWVLSKPNAGVVDLGQNAMSCGLNNQSLSECAHAEGKNNKAIGKYAHVEGKENEGHYCSHVEGSNNKALGNTSHAEGTDNRALNSNTHVEGRYTSARGYASHAEGYGESVEVSTEASGEGAHAEGRVTKAQGNYSHTEGQYTSAVGIASHAEGKGESVDNPNLAYGNYSHVEGEKTKATNIAAHAEGIITTSSGKAAHAEGRETQALADYSHAEGYLSSVVSGAIGGHSEGVYNIVNNSAEHASGKYNVSIPKTADNTTADATHFSIGIGTSDTVRKNAFEVKQNGDIYIEGIEGRIQDKLNTTPDWSASREDAGYIANRTHYKAEKISYGNGIGYGDVLYDDNDNPIVPKRVRLRSEEGFISEWIDVYDGYGEYFEELYLYDEYGDIQDTYSGDITVDMYTSGVELSMGTANYYVDLDYSTIKKLSEEFIPDTIARKSDLENIGGGGSVDSEEIIEIKTTLESHEELIEDLQNMKIDKENDDYYPNMSVGVADNLSGVDVVASEFTSRQSGGGAILDGTARIEAIKGNSVVWNQLVKAPKFDGSADSWDASTYLDVELLGDEEIYLKADGNNPIGNAICSPKVPLLSGHTYLYSFDIMRSIAARLGVYLGGQWWATGYNMSSPENAANVWQHVSQITTPKDSLERGLWIYPWNSADEQEAEAWLKNVVVYDLTQMFGAGNEPATVEEFKKRIPIGVDPMLYNEGQMLNLNPSGIKSYSADEESIERFQDLSLIGTLFPDGMKSVGEFHDEIRYNKETQKWEKITRIGEVDLGSLNWSYASDAGYFYSRPSEDIGSGNTFKDTNKQVVLINSADFTGLHWSAFTNNYVSPRNNAISLFYTPDYDAVRANICCDAYTDVASFKEYLQGKKTYFVLNDPIVEEIDFDGNLDYQVWNGGTEELVADNPSSALKADIVYGFNAYGKIKELEGRIDNLGTGGGGTGGSTITVDSALSDTSTNPVQNKVINEKLTELSAEVGKKQDTISDLETIRSGASKGATAIQEVKTINGQSIVGSGNITIEGGGGSTPSGGDEMQRMIAGASANFIWEDVDGKIHCETGEFKTRFGQNNPSFSTSVKKIIACSFDSTAGPWAYFFGTDTSSIEEIYPYAFTSPKLTGIQSAFLGMVKVKDLSFAKYIDTSKVTTLNSVFSGATADEVDVSRWNTSKVTVLGGSTNFFGKIKNIIGLENWDTSLVTNMKSMFGECISNLDGIKEWNVSSCDNFMGLFESCNTEKVDLSKWQFKTTAEMSRMCILSKIKEFGLPNIPQGLATGNAFSYMEQLVNIFMQDASLIHASLKFQQSNLLNAMSVKVILSHLADTHDEGATITFNNALYAKYSAEDKAEIDALRDAATSNGWIIVNMG